jgi:cytochrome c5
MLRFRRSLIIAGILVTALLIVLGFAYNRYAPNRPVVYDDILEQFKYGSIGSDIENGLPIAVLKVLPRMFPEYLPQALTRDYSAFGFVQEPGHDLPIGFSTRRRIVDLTGLNCSGCHVGVVRETPESEPMVILGMPSNTTDLQAFFEFLFKSVADPRFTADNVIAEIAKDQTLLPTDRLIYRSAIPRVKEGLLARQSQLTRLLTPDHPRFGPGRVDTFNTYKTNQFAAAYPGEVLPEEERFGTVDFPSIWNQGVREGMNLHWDGNNSSVRDRNLSAAFGAGATCQNVDIRSLDRIKAWLDTLAPPKYPFPITSDQTVLNRGKAVYDEYCADCHALSGSRIGEVEPIAEIGTDEHRLNSYTDKMVELQLNYCKGYPSALTTFKKTNGYANQPLDGIWARAPYLHNGSVPSMWDLLTPAEQRNNGQPMFYTGHGVYDTENMGFRTDVAEVDGRKSFEYMTTQTGNSNKGHTGAAYGTDLPDADKRALIEYLKTQ